MNDNTIPTPRLPSLAPLTLGNAEPLAMIPAAAAAGFDSIGLRLVSRGQTPSLVDDRPSLDDVATCLADHGVRVLEVLSIRLESDTRVDTFAPLFAASVQLGASYVLVTSQDANRGRAIDNLGRLGELAAQYRIRPGLEFWRFSEVRSLQEAREFVEDTGQPNLGIVVDTLHLHRSGGDPASVAALPPQLHAFRATVRCAVVGAARHRPLC